MPKNNLVAPIVKWVGGKRQLIPEILSLVPTTFSTYVEPFVGGGAILFELQPKKAIINDYNTELINVYKVIKESPEKLIKELEIHKQKNSSQYYYKIRELDRMENFSNLNDIKKAARIVYLNKTCYNGLYRVNSSGHFNSPYGRYKKPNIVNAPTIKAISNYFNKNDIIIKNGDYKDVLTDLKNDAFVYFDPPYVPISTSSSFTGYTENGFGLKQQEELKTECDKLTKKGIRFILSNSDCEFIRELYKDYKIITVKARRTINSQSQKRGEINEVLIYNEV